MATYPVETGRIRDAMILVQHRSWKAREQFALARYYLVGTVWANSYPYEAFSQFMSLGNYVRIFDGWQPSAHRDVSLLTYFLGIALSKMAKKEEDRRRVDELMNRLWEGVADNE